MRRFILIAMLIMICSLHAEIFKAMELELKRNQELKMENMESPYFIQYNITDVQQEGVRTSCGALFENFTNSNRRLSVIVRVGDYKLDNTNYEGANVWSFYSEATVPNGDLLIPLAYKIWEKTDKNYKLALEHLSRKKTIMHGIPNLVHLPDFSKNEGVIDTLCNEISLPKRQEAQEEVGLRLSAELSQSKYVQRSCVSLSDIMNLSFIANTENTRVKSSVAASTCSAIACGQTAGGHYCFSSRREFASAFSDIPRVDVLELRNEIENIVNSDTTDYYIGPVMFVGQASSQFFYQLLADRLGSPRKSISENQRPFENFGNRLGKRVMAKGFDIYDDPTISHLEDEILIGSYDYDREAVKPQRVELVKDGILRDFLSCRTPTSFNSESNGHGRSSWGKTSPWLGNLFITPQEPIDQEKIVTLFKNRLKDLDLEYGIVVERIFNPADFAVWKTTSLDAAFKKYSQQMQANMGGLYPPIVAYRLYRDGHREYLHKTKFLNITSKTLFDIEAASKDFYIDNIIQGFGVSIIAPNKLLLRDVEISNMEINGDRLPVLGLIK